MTRDEQANHMLRIANCLQTILDLEPELNRLEMGSAILEEFGVLKSFLEKIDQVDLDEGDVERIERATSNFLQELNGPLSQLGQGAARSGRLQ